MAFYNPGEHLSISTDGKTISWEDKGNLNGGCVFSKEPIPIDKRKILCKLELQAKIFGMVFIGLFFKNPMECISQVDRYTPLDVRKITYVTVKKGKEAIVELTNNGSLESVLRSDGSDKPERLQINVPSGTKSFWIFVKFVFGDIRVSLTGKQLQTCQFMKINKWSKNTEFDSDGSARLVDQYFGHSCRLSKKLEPWDVLALKISPVIPEGKGRSLFTIFFTTQAENDSRNTVEHDTPYRYEKKNFKGDICFVYQENSIMCGDKVICHVSDQTPVDLELKIVLSSVEIKAHRKANLQCQRRPSDQSTASYASITLVNPEMENSSASESIIQRSYHQLVKRMNYLEVLDVLFSRNIMSKTDHRSRVFDKDTEDDMKRRLTVDWMVDHAMSITESELIEIFQAVGQKALLILN